MIRTCGLRLIESPRPAYALRHLATSAEYSPIATPPRRGNTKNAKALLYVPPGGRIFHGAAPKCVRSFSTTAHTLTTAAPTEVETPNYSFHTAASYSPKGVRYNPERDVWNRRGGARVVPEKSKLKARSEAGQDAFFIAELADGEAVAVGVVRRHHHHQHHT
jgi:hypothetical protein